MERSGEALGLSAADRALLERDGDQYAVTLAYRWRPAPGHVVQPQIGFRDNDRNGDAIKHDGYWVQLTYSYRRDPWAFAANALFGKTDYEADNPIYNARQDSDHTILGATLFYRLPTASRRWSVAGLLTYGDSDSDIDFHDTSVLSAILGLAYRF